MKNDYQFFFCFFLQEKKKKQKRNLLNDPYNNAVNISPGCVDWGKNWDSGT